MTSLTARREALEAAFPGVQFTVKSIGYARGTNNGIRVVSVLWNSKRHPISSEAIRAVAGADIQIPFPA